MCFCCGTPRLPPPDGNLDLGILVPVAAVYPSLEGLSGQFRAGRGVLWQRQASRDSGASGLEAGSDATFPPDVPGVWVCWVCSLSHFLDLFPPDETPYATILNAADKEPSKCR